MRMFVAVLWTHFQLGVLTDMLSACLCRCGGIGCGTVPFIVTCVADVVVVVVAARPGRVTKSLRS